MSANKDQAAPKPVTAASGSAVWDLVLAGDQNLPEWLREDIAERDKIGLERYGQRLRVHNGRSSLLDAYQEALDLWVYLTQSLQRTLEMMGTERTAATALLSSGLAHHLSATRAAVVWLGQLVHAKTELL